MGNPPRFLTSLSGVSSRYTDPSTLEIITMAITGRVNPSIVTQLVRQGIKAIGLAGIDGNLLEARRKSAIKAIVDGKVMIVRDDLTGKITNVNTGLLHLLLDGGFVPVVSPPAIDPEVGAVNVDADRTAAMIAAALKAEHLIILSNVPGLLKDPEEPSSLIPTISTDEMEQSMKYARGRMKLKLIASSEAVTKGVGKVTLADGRLPSPIMAALRGKGTVIKKI